MRGPNVAREPDAEVLRAVERSACRTRQVAAGSGNGCVAIVARVGCSARRAALLAPDVVIGLAGELQRVVAAPIGDDTKLPGVRRGSAAGTERPSRTPVGSIRDGGNRLPGNGWPVNGSMSGDASCAEVAGPFGARWARWRRAYRALRSRVPSTLAK